MEELINGFTGFARKAQQQQQQSARRSGPKGPDEANAARAQDEQAEKPVFDPDQLALIPETDRRWSWVEIDLSAIRHNVGVARSLIKPSTRLLAVVKSDAYGHGAVRVAKTALQSGANYLAVATVDEGIKLREGMVGAPIVLLSEPPATAAPLAVDIDRFWAFGPPIVAVCLSALLLAYKIMPSIYTPEFAIAYAEKADEYGIRAPFHLAVNTGMNRIGVRYDNVVDFMRKVSWWARSRTSRRRTARERSTSASR